MTSSLYYVLVENDPKANRGVETGATFFVLFAFPTFSAREACDYHPRETSRACGHAWLFLEDICLGPSLGHPAIAHSTESRAPRAEGRNKSLDPGPSYFDRRSSTSSGCRSSNVISWIVGPLGSRRPRSYLSNAFSPTRNTAPASRCESFNFVRTRRIVEGDGMPSTLSLRVRQASSTTLISLPTCTPSPIPVK